METMKSREQLREEEKRLIAEIENRHGKSVEQLYEEREKRVRDAIELREPDRVPVILGYEGGNFAARYCGVPLSAAYYDPLAYSGAYRKMMLDFEPDMQRGTAAAASSGFTLEVLDAKQTRWPGGQLPPNVSHQFVEGEYMKADEYDLFLSDPTDFVLRCYLPRVFGALAPLSKLPPMRTMTGTGFAGLVGLFTRPEFKDFAGKLYQAGQHQEKLRQEMADFVSHMIRLGFPPHRHGGGVGGAPFDAISDHLRGMRGSMVDMYRYPEKLLAACDKILDWRIGQAVPADPKTKGNPKLSGSALHRGSDGFMSLKQFETFYWPGLKKAIETDVKLGYVHMAFCEGVWDDRLEYWLEVPKGRVICYFEKSDMIKAKKVLGDHLCIMGNVPSTLLEVGSPQEVEDYCKNLIRVCGKGGGFILSPGSSTDEAKPANIKAMIDSAKKYGWY